MQMRYFAAQAFWRLGMRDDPIWLSAAAIVRDAGPAVGDIIRELHNASVVAHRDIGRDQGLTIMTLANAIEIAAEVTRLPPARHLRLVE
ncbi:hypothetical protein JQK15_03865 [Sphingobium sp. BHU LFT2]|uniref:hypothetical protein n=1 Tax=Sphingobium sp. BHU LFT2 TaxID=2807634 RepID=UPI001BECA136|nr:hypothetical protein [Sphingobium sp. BHU LFT2]MBT2242665.1 hypothetical protein [Sphingobium sp. BHU LFT2]